MNDTIRIHWEERIVTRYDAELDLADMPEAVRARLEAGGTLDVDLLGELRVWLGHEGAELASGAADLIRLDVDLLRLGGRRMLRDDDGRPLPYVGDTLTIWFAGGDPAGVGGEVTQVTGARVTLDHTDTYDLELASDWRVRPRA